MSNNEPDYKDNLIFMNTVQANELDDNSTQANLTEQWKKGELPEGHYYVKDGGNMIAEYIDGYFYNNGNPMTSFSGGVDSVLAPVPSYEEYLSLTYAKEEDEKIIAEYEKENAQLKEQINHLLKTQARQFVDNQKLQIKAEKAKDVVNIDTARQIKQLKELLKECKRPLKVYIELFGIKVELLTKINEVLK